MFTLRYQFLEEAFQNQKGIIETSMAKLQEKKNYVHYSVSQVQSRCVLFISLDVAHCHSFCILIMM